MKRPAGVCRQSDVSRPGYAKSPDHSGIWRRGGRSTEQLQGLGEAINFRVSRIDSIVFQRKRGRALRGDGDSQTSPTVTQVRASTFRQAVTSRMQFSDSPHNAETILAALQDLATRTKLGDLHLRYVMVLDVDATDSPTRTQFGMDGRQGILVWGINREWTHFADFSATVVDLREVREAGVITANASGKSSYAIMAVWILPLPPFPTSFSASESRACNALSLALADFVRGKD